MIVVLVRALWLCAVMSSMACAVWAPKDEYARYRAFRTAEGADARLRRAREYLDDHPSGTWSDGIRAELKGAETPLFDQRATETQGLELYLYVYPDGIYAAQARSRLAAVTALNARRQAAAEREAAGKQAALRQGETRRRQWLARFVTQWLTTLLSLEGWNDSLPNIAAANPAFSNAFGRAPKPRCSRNECVKDYTSSYGIRVPGGTRLERTVQLQVRLVMREGRMVRAELLLPGWGFSRWSELERQELVVDTDRVLRRGAVQRARQFVGALLGSLSGAGASDVAEAVGVDRAEFAWSAPQLAPSGLLIDPGSDHIEHVVPMLGAKGRVSSAPRADDILPVTSAGLAPLTTSAVDLKLPTLVVAKGGGVRRLTLEGGAGVTTDTASVDAPAEAATAQITELDPEPAVDGGGAGTPARAVVRYQTRAMNVWIFDAAPGAGGAAFDGIVVEPAAGRTRVGP